ncbi:MAG TPA: M6 family metalloprotease domain-containing protein [Allosphingosinicella sp.]
MSLPFIDEEFTFTQPDGTTFQARGTGNQKAATFETLDGFTIVQDPVSHFYHYARPGPGGALESAGIRPGAAEPKLLGLKAGLRQPSIPGSAMPPPVMEGLDDSGMRWRQRREAFRQQLELSAFAEHSGLAFAPPSRRTVGNFVGLTLLIDFEDFPATIARDQIEAFCNQPGYTGFSNNGSVRDYFHAVSDGRLEYTNHVTPYYRAKHKRCYYTDPKVEYTLRAIELIREALDHLMAGGFDPSALTSDDQDYVYAVNVFYAGRRINNWREGLWPHAHYVSGGGYQLAPGKIAYDYQITDLTNELSLGTFCHENGHLICDFPDLYDYADDKVNSQGVGVFCLMCAGGSDAGAKNPAQVGAYLKHAAGWTSSLDPLDPGSSVTLVAGANEFAIRRKNQDEYFIVENRAATGRDAMLPGSGLAVWHCDRRGDNENQGGTPTLHYECALMQADGLRELERNIDLGDAQDLFRADHKDSFTTATNPSSNWWDQSASGLQLLRISAAGPSMTFEVG